MKVGRHEDDEHLLYIMKNLSSKDYFFDDYLQLPFILPLPKSYTGSFFSSLFFLVLRSMFLR
jgi:hypothetical protein